MVVAVFAPSATLRILGAPDATDKLSDGGVVGVRTMPPSVVVMAGVIAIDPATLPV